MPPDQLPSSDSGHGEAESRSIAYPLARDQDERDRLDRQGRALRPTTRWILEQAGLRQGMRVLDLGSGAGDNALVARELVGPSGLVLGIDRSADAVHWATRRAEAGGFSNVSFRVQDIHERCSDSTFDAVIGRLVLMYSPDPAAVLRTHAASLVPGGVVVAVEFDVSACRSLPPTPLVDQLVESLGGAFINAGFDMALGTRLWTVLTNAGLRPAGMVCAQPHFGPGDPDGALLLAGILHSAKPLVQRTGTSLPPALEAVGFQQRLADQLATANAVLAYPAFFGAWATTLSTNHTPDERRKMTRIRPVPTG
jgi:SAM-dependent methyltransferase